MLTLIAHILLFRVSTWWLKEWNWRNFEFNLTVYVMNDSTLKIFLIVIASGGSGYIKEKISFCIQIRCSFIDIFTAINGCSVVGRVVMLNISWMFAIRSADGLSSIEITSRWHGIIWATRADGVMTARRLCVYVSTTIEIRKINKNVFPSTANGMAAILHALVQWRHYSVSWSTNFIILSHLSFSIQLISIVQSVLSVI